MMVIQEMQLLLILEQTNLMVLVIDITPPSIIYTVFDPTTSTSNRTLSNVTITDQSGVNVTHWNCTKDLL